MAFSRYSQAADLGNGIAWYATLGVAASVLELTAAAATVRAPRGRAGRLMLMAAAGTVGHLLVIARAAPLNLSQRAAGDDPAVLADILDQFATLNTLRASLQVVALAALVGGLLGLGSGAERGTTCGASARNRSSASTRSSRVPATTLTRRGSSTSGTGG